MNIYVGNLSYDATEDELRQHFGAYGAVKSAKIIMDRDSGRSKGFAFVEMENDDEGRSAIEGLDGSPINGRNVKVNEARPKSDNPRPQKQFQNRGGKPPRKRWDND